MRWVKHHRLILTILLVGSVLRFWDFWDIPYTHDELSALGRARVSSWAEFIEIGIMGDNHPGGVQWLIWGMTRLAGFSTGWIKLPFALAGVWSIWLLYLVGKRLVSEQTGLVCAALMATLQYPITYSQWARPYAIGVALVLLLTWALLRFRDASGRGNAYLVVFSLAAAACGYTHYFALLQAILIGMAFVPLLDRKQVMRLMLFSVLAALLWLPHLNLTLFHLERGGIGEWLKPPKGWYWWHMIRYTFQFSVWPVILLVAVSLRQLTRPEQWLRSYNRYMLAGAFIIPYVLGYLYSVFSNPLLHQSVLLFSMPFFLLWCGAFVMPQRNVVRLTVLALVVINTVNLIRTRDHFEVNYRSEYGSALHWLAQLKEQEHALPALVDLREDLVALMHEEALVPAVEMQMVEPLVAQKAIVQWLNNQRGDRLFLAMNSGTDPEVLAAALDRFPCILEAQYYNVGEAYLLGNTCDSRTLLDTKPLADLPQASAEQPYTPKVELSWKQLDHQTNLHAVVTWQGKPADGIVVLEVSDAEGEAYWRGVNLREHYDSTAAEQLAYQVLYNSEMEVDGSERVVTYIWLNHATEFFGKRIEVFAVPANPRKYALFLE